MDLTNNFPPFPRDCFTVARFSLNVLKKNVIFERTDIVLTYHSF